ncbi:MAG: hypothetical protein QOK43_139, partial [Acidimicrobiaceae bacterium]|nr:hypothetical protein [Acidimicrobiaceae bacterium]
MTMLLAATKVDMAVFVLASVIVLSGALYLRPRRRQPA